MPTIPERAANVSLYAFESAQLASDTFQVVRFEGTEGLSQLFRFDLHLISEDPDISFEKVVNKPATFTMVRGDEDVPVHGIVTDFSLHGQTGDYVVYRATLQPRLQRLSLNYGSRIFQEKTVEDILRTVLKEDELSPSDFRFALQSSYSPREYCVQYEETDLNFISRLMEFEGMYYFFEHEDGKETLVITDQKSEHEKIPAPASLQYHEGAGGMVDEEEETVRQFVCEEQVVTGKVRLRNYDPRKPDTVSAESEINSDMPGTRYEYGEHFRESGRGDRLAKVRNEEIESQRRVLRGESNSLGFQSGYLFTLKNHYREELNADYLLTQITHRGSQRAGLDLDARYPQRDSDPEPEYRNDFTCIPATVQYRAPRDTPKPEVPGILTAKIESAGGDYAYIDDQGRYRAKMHFDRLEGDRSNRSEGSRSLPIRMKQAYSGSDYGIHFPNHADTEMIVAFENGDIDRPMALGTAPNPSNTSPVVSDNKSQNIIRSSAGNELLVEDQEDETEIRLTTAKGHEASLDDGEKRIRFETSGEHTLEMDDDDKFIAIDSSKGHSIYIDDEGKKMESDDQGVAMVTDSGHGVGINDGDNWIKISTDKKNRMRFDDDRKIVEIETENKNELILDDKKSKMGLKSHKGHFVKISNGDEEGVILATDSGHGVGINDSNNWIEILTNGGYSVSLDDDESEVEIEAGSNEIEIDESKDEIEIDAGKKIKLKCGQSSIILKRSGKIEIEGLKVKIKGKQKVEASGLNLKTDADVKNEVKGAIVKSKAKGINKVGGSLTKVG